MTPPDPNGAHGTSGFDAKGRPRPPLRTEPRPYWMHVAVDAIIGFCTVAFLLWLFGVALWAMIIVGWIVGLAAAPFTRRWEARQLAARNAAP
jgi:hypothetical protein